MIWTHAKTNRYYNNSKGRIFLSWPYRLIDYWNEMRGSQKEDFNLLWRSADQPVMKASATDDAEPQQGQDSDEEAR